MSYVGYTGIQIPSAEKQGLVCVADRALSLLNIEFIR